MIIKQVFEILSKIFPIEVKYMVDNNYISPVQYITPIDISSIIHKVRKNDINKDFIFFKDNISIYDTLSTLTQKRKVKDVFDKSDFYMVMSYFYAQFFNNPIKIKTNYKNVWLVNITTSKI